MGTAPNGYQPPKTNWTASDPITTADLNRIEGNILAVEEGSRTVDQTQTPTGNTGTLRQLFDWLVNRIRAITGKTNWYENPDISLAALVKHKSRHAVGGADPLTPADIGAVPTSGNPTISGTLSVSGNAGVFNIVGTDHVYFRFFPRGTGSGRKAYLGFPGPNSKTLTVAQEDAGNIDFRFPSGYDLVVNGTHRIRHEGNFNAFSFVSAYRNASLSISPSVWTKIVFNTEVVDYLGEFDTASGKFTAKKTGVYIVSFRVTFDNPPAGNQYQAAVYLNGSRAYIGNTGVTPGGFSVASTGCFLAPLSAGNTIEIYAFCGPNGPVGIKYGNLTETAVWVARIG